MATYVNDLRLKEIATGDESGTWGTSTNTNLELIANAMGVGAEAIANASTHTITMADGTADEFRSTFLRLTGGGTACTVTLAPNTLSHTWIMRNETAAALTLTQGSGANVVIAAGQTKIVATDGAGSGAIVYEMDDLELAGNLAVDGAITSSSGATITVADNSNNLTLTSTDGDANAGPKLDLYRNSTSPADADLLGRINFRGRNDNSQDVDYAAWVSRISDASDGSEDGILRADIIAAGAVVDVLTLYGTEVVVNESSADVDFRVESNGNANMLFVDGGNDRIGIGAVPTDGTLHIQTASAGTVAASSQADDLVVENSTEGGMTIITPDDQSARIRFTSPSTNNDVGGATIFYRQNINKMLVGTAVSGGTLSLASGAGDETMVLDGSGKVGIGTSVPSALLGLNAAAPDFTMLQSDSVKFRMGVSNTTNGGVTGSASGDFFARTTGGKMLFSTDDGVTSAMSIDANDNLLVLTTASGSAGLNVNNSVNIGFSEGSNSSLANIFRQASSAATVLASGYKVSDTANKMASSYASAWARSAIGCFYGSIRFFADAAATVAVGTDITPTEVMRLDSSGNLLVGTATLQGRITVTATGSTTIDCARTETSTANNIVLRNGNGAVGSIQTSGSATSYNTSSDQRLKENIADADDAGSKVDAIQVRKFDWKVDGSHQDYGMVAQELQTVAPEAVSAPEDPNEMMGVDYSKLVPMLVKEIQSLRARVNALEAE